jgi:hypothetical protein
MRTKSHLRVVSPTNQNRSVALSRRKREYLTPVEIDKLIAAAKKTSRYPQRDATCAPARLAI